MCCVQFTGQSSTKFDEIMKKWKTMNAHEREEFRDEVNTRTMFSRCEEIGKDMLDDQDALDEGDFIICRYALEENKEYHHDHLAFVTGR